MLLASCSAASDKPDKVAEDCRQIDGDLGIGDDVYAMSGSSEYLVSVESSQVVLWHNGDRTVIGSDEEPPFDSGFHVADVNSSGAVVGYVGGSESGEPFRYVDGEFAELKLPDELHTNEEVMSAEATAINDEGDIVGFATTRSGHVGLRWNGDSTMGERVISPGAQPHDISHDGGIVGLSGHQGYYWEPDGSGAQQVEGIEMSIAGDWVAGRGGEVWHRRGDEEPRASGLDMLGAIDAAGRRYGTVVEDTLGPGISNDRPEYLVRYSGGVTEALESGEFETGDKSTAARIDDVSEDGTRILGQLGEKSMLWQCDPQ